MKSPGACCCAEHCQGNPDAELDSNKLWFSMLRNNNKIVRKLGTLNLNVQKLGKLGPDIFASENCQFWETRRLGFSGSISESWWLAQHESIAAEVFSEAPMKKNLRYPQVFCVFPPESQTILLAEARPHRSRVGDQMCSERLEPCWFSMFPHSCSTILEEDVGKMDEHGRFNIFQPCYNVYFWIVEPDLYTFSDLADLIWIIILSRLDEIGFILGNGCHLDRNPLPLERIGCILGRVSDGTRNSPGSNGWRVCGASIFQAATASDAETRIHVANLVNDLSRIPSWTDSIYPS